jgi:cell division protein FtsB
MKFKRAVLILIIFVALAGIHLYIYTQNIDIKYRVTDLKTKLTRIRTRNRQLGITVAKKENLSYIENVAKNKLGMIYPEKINYVLSNPGQVSKEARP